MSEAFIPSPTVPSFYLSSSNVRWIQPIELATNSGIGKGDTPPRLMDFMHRSIVTATALLFFFPYIGLATRHQSARARRKTPATKRCSKQYGHHKGRGCWLTPCLSYEQQLCSQALNCPSSSLVFIMSKRSVRNFHFYQIVGFLGFIFRKIFVKLLLWFPT